MKLIGLTGGIAAGKSTVARMFADLGCPILDADEVARDVVEPGTPALAAIARAWPDVVRADGTLDRAALGRKVFADPNARDALDGIVMPRIVERIAEKSRALEAAGAKVALYDAALIVEKGADAGLDGLVVVDAPEAARIERMVRRDGLTADEARQRIAAQMPADEKRRRATWVIDNVGSLEDTRRDVERIWKAIRDRT